MEAPLTIKQKHNLKTPQFNKKLTIKLTLKTMEKLQQKSSMKKGRQPFKRKNPRVILKLTGREKKHATKWKSKDFSGPISQ
jgi:hypothetical protein